MGTERRARPIHDGPRPVPLLGHVDRADGRTHRRPLHGGPATNVYVSFDFALQPDPLAPGISPAEPTPRAAHYITGTAHPDPGWTGSRSPSSTIRASSSSTPRPRRSGRESLRHRCSPWALSMPIRAHSRTRRSRSSAMALTSAPRRSESSSRSVARQHRSSRTSNAKWLRSRYDNDSKAGGGSCFGDSGGPAFLGPYVVGDASYVNSLTCNATGTYQRVDTAYSRAFLEQFL